MIINYGLCHVLSPYNFNITLYMTPYFFYQLMKQLLTRLLVSSICEK